MSNARSPREVCSTTIGTRGLMVLALFRSAGGIPSGCKHVSGRIGASVATGRPRQTLFRAGSRTRRGRAWTNGLLGGVRGVAGGGRSGLDGGRVLDDEVERRALARDPRAGRRGGRPSRAGRAASRASCRSRAALACSASRTSPSLGSMPSASTIAASTASRSQRALGVGGALLEELLLRLAGDLEVHVALDALVLEVVEHALQQLAARAPRSARSGRSTVACSTAASSTASRNSASARSSSCSLSRVRDVLAQLVERVEARGVGGELVVELRQDLAPDLLDGDRELAVLPGEVLGLVVVGEAHRRPCARRRRSRRTAAPRSRGSGGRTRAR